MYAITSFYKEDKVNILCELLLELNAIPNVGDIVRVPTSMYTSTTCEVLERYIDYTKTTNIEDFEKSHLKVTIWLKSN